MMTFSCFPLNDLFAVLASVGSAPARCDTPAEAVRAAEEGTAVLVLADRYSEKRTGLRESDWELARTKRLRLYVEYPGAVPGFPMGDARPTEWERVVVGAAGMGALAAGTILSVSDCRYLPAEAAEPWLVSARVAGYDTAVFGIPVDAAPILFEAPGLRALIATTQLSGFVTGRYGPSAAWKAVWEAILQWLDPGAPVPSLAWDPVVRPRYSAGEELPPDAERQALGSSAEWVHRSGLLIAPGRSAKVRELLRSGVEVAPRSDGERSGDGSLGVLEGFSSAIRHDGTQSQRLPIRADCQAETAMVLAMDCSVNGAASGGQTARRLLDFLYRRSGLHGGARGNPEHPAFGLIAWGVGSAAWEVANYGDDNARAILATVLASACPGAGDWDAPVARALLANLRTTGRMGFRGNRIDIPDLERRGWRSYADADTANPAPHYEAYLWACYLWAYRQTGDLAFLESATAGIRLCMEAYPGGWLFNDISERAQMLLPLAWLVRLDATSEHIDWLRRVSDDLIAVQDPCGALPERFMASDGYYRIPRSNEEYGVTETPLIQRNGDPASDQLYTSGFALLGLHEAAAATGDPAVRDAEDRLARYLCRIQVKSERIPCLDGAWFRAFDFHRWDYWASSADAGWGAWCVEAGWGAAWTAAVLGLRGLKTSFWERTSGSRIAAHLGDAREQMGRNDGGPWTGHAGSPV